jgi:hypothetical protein
MATMSRPTFDTPGLQDRDDVRKLNAAERDAAQARKEWHGGTYGIEVWSDGRHDGEPQQRQLALREPAGYQHPQHMGNDVIDPGGPRILPVSQKVTHRPQQSRQEGFSDAALRSIAVDVHAFHSEMNFRDRRIEGRRYRPTNNVDDLFGPQEPYDIKGWQRDVPAHRYLEA